MTTTFQSLNVTKDDIPDLVKSVIAPSLRQHPSFPQLFPPWLSHFRIHAWLTEHLENQVAMGSSLQRRFADDRGNNVAFVSCQLVQWSDEAAEWRQAWRALGMKYNGVTRRDVQDVVDAKALEEVKGVFEGVRGKVLGERKDVLSLVDGGFVVRPGEWGKGLANRMVEWMTGVADEEGWCCCAVVPGGLRGTFERWGFVVGREGVVWRGEEFVCVVRDARGEGEKQGVDGDGVGGGERMVSEEEGVGDYDPFGLLGDGEELSADECLLPVDEEGEGIRRDAGFYR